MFVRGFLLSSKCCVWLTATAALILLAGQVVAHEITFNSSMTYSDLGPSAGSDSIANWVGADFDAANIGGSGVNADGGDNNGTANDAFTYVAIDRPVQGQTFRTGSAANGYRLNAITVQMAGYTNNIATGSNRVSWNLHEQNGPIILRFCEISGARRKVLAMQSFKAGDVGNPGTGTTVNGSGDNITFHLPFTTDLKPDATYGFELQIGNGSGNYFEWLGTNDPGTYADGTAYHPSGDTITSLDGDRVFQVDMTALASPQAGFAHPGTLHAQADLDRMKAKIAAGEEPWVSGYNMLLSSPYNNLGWPAYDIDYIIRGVSGSNYTRSQQDAQLIYTLTLIWHLTGDTAYADRAVHIANVWSDLKGVTGNSNLSLGAGICGYLFAIAGDLLSTYEGWVQADKQAYKDMMMRVFYPANYDFLWRHHDTFWREGGNTHYRLNWDTANMASMAAIGVLCDNRAVYEQAVDFYKHGPGNGRIQRAAWYIHPDGTAQTEEIGRDQGHNLIGWYQMALLCQTAWNQGDDLWGYDNNRVLRALEHTTKWNLWHDVPWVHHRNTTLGYTETLSSYGRGALGMFHELAYNHYVNIKGLAAPYTQVAAEAVRPERWPNTSNHPSEVDWFGHGTLTFSQNAISEGAVPSGLQANWSKNQIVLNWWGSAYATSYNVKRSTNTGGPYEVIGTAGKMDTSYRDPDLTNGTTYYYVVSANNTEGEGPDSTELRVAQELKTHYAFEDNVNDIAGDQDSVLKGGSTGVPVYTGGLNTGKAVLLDGVDDFVQLPVGVANYQDMTVACWVYWNGGGAWQRIFDFGTEIEKNMFLTPSNGGSMRFVITTSRGAEASGFLDGPVMPVNQWTHVAVSLSGDVGTLYVNGKPVDTEIIDMVDPLFSQVYCYIGRSMWNADPFFKGRIDDFRIYNYGLSGDEIWTVFGQSTNAAPVFQSDPLDFAGADEDQPYSGQTLAPNVSDMENNTLVFEKLAGPDWLQISANGSLTGTPVNGDVGENRFVVRVTDTGGATDDAVLRLVVANTNDAPVWSQEDFTPQAARTGKPYSFSVSGLVEDIDVGDSLTFSKVSGPGWVNVSADGTVSGTPAKDDRGDNSVTVRVTDAEGLSDDKVFTFHVYESPVEAFYKFEGDTQDSAGKYPGTAVGSPVYTDGLVGRSLELDGVDDYVQLPAGITDSDGITVTAWVNWDGGSQWQRIWDFGSGSSSYMFLTPSSGDDTLRFAISTNGWTGEQRMDAVSLPTGEWMHLAVTLEGDTGRLYMNGILVDADANMTINPSQLKTVNNYIGKSQFDTDPLFNGQVDDFRIYHFALSQDEIAELADRQVNAEDVADFASWWLWLVDDCGVESDCLAADIDSDGIVNAMDYAKLTSDQL